MKYDDATWHSNGVFPPDLPPEAGGTHTAMFLAWALLSDLAGDLLLDPGEKLERLMRRELTPGQFFFLACDGQFIDDHLNEEGNAFAQSYFDLDKGQYMSDYEQVLAAPLPSQYHVPDTWESFDRLRPTLDQRLAAWRVNPT
jgi:hypothetical protein